MSEIISTLDNQTNAINLEMNIVDLKGFENYIGAFVRLMAFKSKKYGVPVIERAMAINKIRQRKFR